MHNLIGVEDDPVVHNPNCNATVKSSESKGDEKHGFDEEKSHNHIHYFANSSRGQPQGAESVLYKDSLGDRRTKTATDRRGIIHCIGRIKTVWSQTAIGFGTGTVFKVLKCCEDCCICFVITCAHNVVKMENGTVIEPIKLYFETIRTFEDDKKPPIILEKHEVRRYVYHAGYIANNKQYVVDENDIAVIAFWDKDGTFDHLLNEKSRECIELYPSNMINEELEKQTNFKYEIHGFPYLKQIMQQVCME